jgi:transcriptional regulator with XRE-family HTH domain
MNGKRTPRPDIIQLIAKALGTSTDYLLGRTDIKQETIYEGDQVSQELQALGVKMFSILGDDLSDNELIEIKKFAEYVRSKRDK